MDVSPVSQASVHEELGVSIATAKRKPHKHAQHWSRWDRIVTQDSLLSRGFVRGSDWTVCGLANSRKVLVCANRTTCNDQAHGYRRNLEAHEEARTR